MTKRWGFPQMCVWVRRCSCAIVRAMTRIKPWFVGAMVLVVVVVDDLVLDRRPSPSCPFPSRLLLLVLEGRK